MNELIEKISNILVTLDAESLSFIYEYIKCISDLQKEDS